MTRVNSKLTGDMGNFLKHRYDIDLRDKELPAELLNAFIDLQFWMDEVLLSRYFSSDDEAEEKGTYWTQQLEFDTRRTGEQLRKRLEEMETATILDVCCGDNEFIKLLGERVTGIDPYNVNADIAASIETFKPGKQYDVVLCLGSINFGDETTIFNQVAKVSSWVAPGGLLIWRCNPGITHDNKHAQWIDFYNWSHEKLQEFCNKIGSFTIVESGWDHEGDDTVRWGNRLYSEWRRK